MRSLSLEQGTRPTRSLLWSPLLLLLTVLSCQMKKEKETEQRGTTLKATRFELEERPYGYSLQILKKENGKSKAHYRLIEAGQEAPEQKEAGKDIRVPVERIACLSSTHAGMLLELGAADRIVAFPARKHLYDQKLRKRMQEGKIQAIGMERSIDKERLLASKADLLLDDGMSGGSGGDTRVLEESGIPTLDIMAWREKDPLGRLEWIRVFGILTGYQEKADSLFQKRASLYDSLASSTPDPEESPEVLCNAPNRGTWHIPGGKSYMAELIRDAGGVHPWPKDNSTGGVPKSLEEVLAKAGDADIWLNPGRNRTLRELVSLDERIGSFRAFQEKSVYNNDKRKEEGRGNDFWESGAVHPELVLKDLLHIFHPEKNPEWELRYHRKLPLTKAR